MRFIAQLLMTVVFGVPITLATAVWLPALLGWDNPIVFWLGFFIGMSAGTQLAYWLSHFIPEPPRPVLEIEAEEDSQQTRFSGETEEIDTHNGQMQEQADELRTTHASCLIP
jgi:hypothetical protein